MTIAAAGAVGLAGITALLALAGGGPSSVLRHLYLAPVIGMAIRFGMPGGALAAAGALLLYSPLVLPALERAGLTAETLEGLVTLASIAVAGVLGGALASRATRQRSRYETILTVQRLLASDVPLGLALDVLRRGLACRLGAREIALVVVEGEERVVAGGTTISPGSAVDRALAEGRPVFVRDAGGGRRPRRVFVTPLLARGRPIGALALERAGEIGGEERAALGALGAHIGLALDNARLASRQRRFAEELRLKVADATRRLEELDRAKSSFVAIASHELRTPLTAIQGFAELLAVRRLGPDEVNRLAGMVRDAAKRLGRVVNDLLDLSRIERGLALELQRAPLAVEPALRAAADLARGATATHPIVVHCAPDLPPVDADADALERILTNLLSNALKYSLPGRPVRVGARRAERDGAVEFTVEDEGAGIPPEALARLFEPYFRAPGAAQTARGTGIGLAVVKSLVENHRGAIRVESALGAGTRVVFSLPAVP